MGGGSGGGGQSKKPSFAERAENYLAKLDPYLRTNPPEPVPESGGKKSPEESRAAALTAGRDRISYRVNPKESLYRSVLIARRAKDLPYKITKYDPDTGIHHVIGSAWSFANAYQHSDDGTHVVQTHGSEAEFERQIRGVASHPPTNPSGGSKGTSMATGAAVGLLVAGPVGAAVGALVGSGGGPQAKWVELPRPIITEKRLTKDSNMTNDATCTSCAGSGMLNDGSTCPTCKGSGNGSGQLCLR